MKSERTLTRTSTSAPAPLPTPAPKRGRSVSAANARSTASKIALYVILIVASIPFLYPTLWMFFSSFKPSNEIFMQPPSLLPRDWTLDSLAQVFTAQPFVQQYGNSIYIAVIVTASSIILSAMAGYAFARIEFPLRNFFFVLMLAAMMVPSEVTIIPIFTAVNSLGLNDTHWPLIILPILGPSSVVSVFIFRQHFLSFPKEYEEAARLDGVSRVGIFFRIAMPLAKPAIAAVGIMAFLRSFNMYFEALIFLRTPENFTLGLAITRYQDLYGEQMWATQLGAASLTVIPILVVFLLAQKQFVQGLTSAGLKG